MPSTRTSRGRARLRGLILLVVLIAGAVGITLALSGGKGKLVPAGGGGNDPLAYIQPGQDTRFEDAATAGEAPDPYSL